ncbi:MAG: alanine racemase, partial [Halanaerobium sp.]
MQKEKLTNNLNQVKKNIKKAAAKAGRDFREIKLLAVSKNQDIKAIKILAEAGVKIFGENRVQELEEKNEKLLAENIDLDWHFIGHLQRNKVKYLM